MAIEIGNWVGEITTTIGYGPLALSGAIDGFTTFSNINAPTGDVYYVIVNGNNRESGRGKLSGSTLQRWEVFSTLFNGIYSEVPSPIYLTGNSQVFCAFGERAYKELRDHTHDITDIPHTHPESDITDLDKYTKSEIDNLLDGVAPPPLYQTAVNGMTVSMASSYYVPATFNVNLPNVEDTISGDFVRITSNYTIPGNVFAFGAQKIIFETGIVRDSVVLDFDQELILISNTVSWRLFANQKVVGGDF